ncbi:MAG: class I SAM-dependent methyltransferase [Solirubrobacterales bacterium]
MHRWHGSANELLADDLFRRIDAVVSGCASRMGHKLDVLDVGAGNLLAGCGGSGGRHYRLLQSHARSYTAVEPSWREIDDITVPDGNIFHLPSPRLVRGVAERLPFGDDSFDTVLALSVLDHCYDPDLALREVARVLRRDGVLVVTLTNFGSWPFALLRALRPSSARRILADDHHATHYDAERLGNTLRSSPLVPVQVASRVFPTVPRAGRLNDLFWGGIVRLIGRERSISFLRQIDRVARVTFGEYGQHLFCISRKP